MANERFTFDKASSLPVHPISGSMKGAVLGSKRRFHTRVRGPDVIAERAGRHMIAVASRGTSDDDIQAGPPLCPILARAFSSGLMAIPAICALDIGWRPMRVVDDLPHSGCIFSDNMKRPALDV